MKLITLKAVQDEALIRQKEAYRDENFVGIFLDDESFVRNLIGEEFARSQPDIVIHWEKTTAKVMHYYEVTHLSGARHYFIKA